MSLASVPRRCAALLAFGGGILLLSLPGPVPLDAQTVEVRVRAFGGVHDPDGGLTNAHLLASPTNVLTYEQLPTLGLAGLGLDVRPSGLPLSFRLSASRAFARQEIGRWGCADAAGEPLPCPSILILVPTEIGSTQIAADAALELPVGPMLVRPLGGMAWVRHDYEWDPTPVGSFSLEPGSHVEQALVLRFGGGLSLPAGPVWLELDHVWRWAASDERRPDMVRTTTLGVAVPVTTLGM